MFSIEIVGQDLDIAGYVLIKVGVPLHVLPILVL